MTEKKIGVGADLQFILPLGDFGDAIGPADRTRRFASATA